MGFETDWGKRVERELALAAAATDVSARRAHFDLAVLHAEAAGTAHDRPTLRAALDAFMLDRIITFAEEHPMLTASSDLVEPLPSKAGDAKVVKVEFTASEFATLDHWISTLPEPRPDHEQAIRMIIRARLKRLSVGTGG